MPNCTGCQDGLNRTDLYNPKCQECQIKILERIIEETHWALEQNNNIIEWYLQEIRKHYLLENFKKCQEFIDKLRDHLYSDLSLEEKLRTAQFRSKGNENSDSRTNEKGFELHH